MSTFGIVGILIFALWLQGRLLVPITRTIGRELPSWFPTWQNIVAMFWIACLVIQILQLILQWAKVI
jgi:hypothetical protein